MKGEFDSPSKPTTSEYRDGWEHIWGHVTMAQFDPAAHHQIITRNFMLNEMFARHQERSYPNGCPILEND